MDLPQELSLDLTQRPVFKMTCPQSPLALKIGFNGCRKKMVFYD